MKYDLFFGYVEEYSIPKEIRKFLKENRAKENKFSFAR